MTTRGFADTEQVQETIPSTEGEVQETAAEVKEEVKPQESRESGIDWKARYEEQERESKSTRNSLNSAQAQLKQLREQGLSTRAIREEIANLYDLLTKTTTAQAEGDTARVAEVVRESQTKREVKAVEESQARLKASTEATLSRIGTRIDNKLAAAEIITSDARIRPFLTEWRSIYQGGDTEGALDLEDRIEAFIKEEADKTKKSEEVERKKATGELGADTGNRTGARGTSGDQAILRKVDAGEDLSPQEWKRLAELKNYKGATARSVR